MPKAEQEIDFLARRKKEELFLFCIWMKIAIEKKKNHLWTRHFCP